MTLHEIGLKHGTDKARFHNYLDFYERHLSDLREGSGVLLELGILDGASLRMWRDWLPNLTIVGWDIERKTVEGCTTDVVNCGDPVAMRSALAKIGTLPIRCIIDDASHKWAHQRAAFTALSASTPIFVMEDLHTSIRPDYGHEGIKPIYDGKTFDLPLAKGTKINVYKGKPDDSWTAIFRKP